MSRTVRDSNLETRAARLRLPTRPKPYWRVLEKGLHLGYRRHANGAGAWIVRRFLKNGRYRESKLKIADDLQAADNKVVLTFGEAQEAARAWWKAEERRDNGHAPDSAPLTVAGALEAYFGDRERRGSKGVAKDRAAASLRVVPKLGNVELSKLTTARIRDWHTDLAKAPKLARPSAISTERKSRPIDLSDADTVRARRATANRTLTVLKAALAFAFQDGHAVSDEVWRKVKPFREVDAPVVRFLTSNECQRLANACQGAFRELVRAALLTGCRYGELVRMRAGDFNEHAGMITVRISKAGKPRHVAMNDEGRALFLGLTAGKPGSAAIFVRDDGKTWGASHQQRPLEVASLRANIDPPATFHILRHTYASALAMKGVPMGVIAAQLGHADTRMTEKHYAHLAPSYVADTVRAALPALGIVDTTNLKMLASQLERQRRSAQ